MHAGQSIIAPGPNWKYSSLDSRELIFDRRISSEGVRPMGRKAERRVKRTSVGIWRREDVRLNMFSGEKKGRVLMRKAEAVMKRIMRARETLGGTGRIGTPWMAGAARTER